MNCQKLVDTARALFTGSKGRVAMDESNPTCNQRFTLLDIPQTEEARRDYRDLIVSTPNLSEFISGAILFDETIRHWDAPQRSRRLTWPEAQEAKRTGEGS